MIQDLLRCLTKWTPSDAISVIQILSTLPSIPEYGVKDSKTCQFTASSLNHITWNLFHPCSRCPYHFIVLSFVRSEKNYFKMKIKKYPRICILYKCYQTFGSNLDGLIFQAPKFKPGECKFPNSSNPTPPDPSIEITFLPQHHSMLPKVAIRYLSKQRVQFICANVQYTKFRWLSRKAIIQNHLR